MLRLRAHLPLSFSFLFSIFLPLKIFFYFLEIFLDFLYVKIIWNTGVKLDLIKVFKSDGCDQVNRSNSKGIRVNGSTGWPNRRTGRADPGSGSVLHADPSRSKTTPFGSSIKDPKFFFPYFSLFFLSTASVLSSFSLALPKNWRCKTRKFLKKVRQ